MPTNKNIKILRKEVEVTKECTREDEVISDVLDKLCAVIPAETVISIKETITHGIQSNGVSGKHLITVKLVVYYRS